MDLISGRIFSKKFRRVFNFVPIAIGRVIKFIPFQIPQLIFRGNSFGFSILARFLFGLHITVTYKRSAGIEALHFQLTDMFVDIQFVSI